MLQPTDSISHKTLVIICGPTAVGKTKLAIELATSFHTEIISADSRQFFRELDIGTAKPSAKDLDKTKHHLINSISIYEEYNVSMFEKDSLKIIEQLFLKNSIAIMVGGSGLYIQAICKGFDEIPSVNKEIREQIIESYNKNGIDFLRNTLKKLDEEHYKKIDLANPHRMIRAIEVCMITGKKFSDIRIQEQNNKPTRSRFFNIIKIGLTIDRPILYQRINNRVDEMIKLGLLDEVKKLEKEVNYKSLNALNTVGYKELFDYLNQAHDLSRAIELIKQNTRNYAKRQTTWFKKDNQIVWFHPDENEKIAEYISATLKNSLQ